MHSNHDLLADLPPQRDDEPSSLRQDIADELADHLDCALRRELLKTGDDVSARTRVLDRFGDPRRIARQLWFQAMWSRIMSQRVVIASSLTMTAAAIAAAVLVGWLVVQQQRQLVEQQQSMLAVVEQLSAALQQRDAETAPVRDQVPLRIRVLSASSPETPVSNISINISPEPMKVGDASPSEMTGADGFADFAYVGIGRYRYTVTLPWGESVSSKFTVHPASEHVETIYVPAEPPPRATLLTSNQSYPKSLKDFGLSLAIAQLQLQPRTIQELGWTASGYPFSTNTHPVTAQCYVVLTDTGRCWTATTPVNPVNAIFYGGGGFGGGSMPVGGMGSGGGFFSIPAESVAALAAPALLSQFSNTPPSLSWQETTQIELTSGDYRIDWLGFGAAAPEDTASLTTLWANGLPAIPNWNSGLPSPEAQLRLEPNSQSELRLVVPAHILAALQSPDAPIIRPQSPGPLLMTPLNSQDSPELPKEPPGFVAKLVPERDGEPLPSKVTAVLRDELQEQYSTRWHRGAGMFTYDHVLHPGRYRLMIAIGDESVALRDLQTNHDLTIKEAERPELEMRLPSNSAIANAHISGPKAKSLSSEATIHVGAILTYTGRDLDGVRWRIPEAHRDFHPEIWFDPETGEVKWLDVGLTHRQFSDDDTPADRFITLRAGEYVVDWQFQIAFKDPKVTPISLNGPKTPRSQILHAASVTVEPDQDSLKLDLSEEVWKSIRERAEAANSPSPKETPSDGSPP